jgi:hypothetical protein
MGLAQAKSHRLFFGRRSTRMNANELSETIATVI